MALRSGRFGQAKASASDPSRTAHRPSPTKKTEVLMMRRASQEPELCSGLELGEREEELIRADFKVQTQQDWASNQVSM